MLKTIAGMNTTIQWIPDSVHKTKDYIPLEGEGTGFEYWQLANTVDVTSLADVNTQNLVVSTSMGLDIDIWRPSNGTIEVNVGDRGLIVAHNQRGTTIHATGFLEKLEYDGESANYSYVLEKVQIGNTTWYVVRVDMGDGTYAELLMTEAEKEYFDPAEFRERKLLEGKRT